MSEPQSHAPLDPGVATIAPRTDVMSGPRDEFAAPLDAATGGRLEIVPGASRVTIAAGAATPDLVRARFAGEAPGVSARDGAVTIRYPRHLLLDWAKGVLRRDDRAATIALNGTIP